MDITPGPVYREILQAILFAKFNGELKTRVEEVEFARSYISAAVLIK
jgi:tRNA nucleotidyltransferase (CCA-adding enzyme)